MVVADSIFTNYYIKYKKNYDTGFNTDKHYNYLYVGYTELS